MVTALAVRRGDRLWERAVVTRVKMKRLSAPEIAAYLATGDWRGKAGGYGIQGPGRRLRALDQRISFTAVVGLPLPRRRPCFGQRATRCMTPRHEGPHHRAGSLAGPRGGGVDVDGRLDDLLIDTTGRDPARIYRGVATAR